MTAADIILWKTVCCVILLLFLYVVRCCKNLFWEILLSSKNDLVLRLTLDFYRFFFICLSLFVTTSVQKAVKGRQRTMLDLETPRWGHWLLRFIFFSETFPFKSLNHFLLSKDAHTFLHSLDLLEEFCFLALSLPPTGQLGLKDQGHFGHV